MKILFYIDSMGRGGAQRVMNNLAEHYASEGASVVLVNDVILDNSAEYPIDTRVRRICLNCNSKKNSNFKRIKTLRGIIKTEKPDTVLSFLGPPNFRMLVATIGLKCRKTVSVRSDPYREYGAGVKKIIANIIFCLADKVIFQTKEASDYFIKKVRDKSVIIYNPVKDDFYRCQWHDGNGGIACVGRVQQEKNPMLLLTAFEKIADKYKDVDLHFYGEGALKEPLRAAAEAMKLSNRVFLNGASSDVPKVLEGSEIFVLCSDYEGMPNALLEAMAVGVPSISTDCPCGGPREIITDKTQGLLVPCNDADGLAAAMDKLLGSKELRQTLSAEGKRRAEVFKSGVIYGKWDAALRADLHT